MRVTNKLHVGRGVRQSFEQSNAMRLTRGKLAERTGCNPETIRYFESVGMIPEPERSESGYRLYGELHLKRIEFIQRAKALGFSTERIRQLLDISGHSNTHTRAQVKALTEEHIQAISKKIDDLERLRDSLRTMSDSCDGSHDSASSCPILLSLSEQQ